MKLQKLVQSGLMFFFESYITSIMPPPISLERPMQMCTSPELESLILRWKTAQVGWDADDESPARQRNIPIEGLVRRTMVAGCYIH